MFRFDDRAEVGANHLDALLARAVRSAVEVDALATHSFAGGDCVPGFTVCAPAFGVIGASVSMLTSIAGPISRDGFTAGAGLGLFRVAPSYYHRVSPRGAVGVQTGLEMPLIDLPRSTLMLALRGLGFLPVHGQFLGMGLMSIDLHAWQAVNGRDPTCDRSPKSPSR